MDCEAFDIDILRTPDYSHPELNYGFWRDRTGTLHRISELNYEYLIKIIKMLDKNDIEHNALYLEQEYRNQKEK